MRIRSIFCTAVMIAAGAQSVAAQEGWRGGYFGLNLNAVQSSAAIAGDKTHDYDTNSASVGGHIGYSFVRPGSSFVWGPELAIQGTGSDDTKTTAALGTSTFDGSFSLSARMRGGYATDKFYFYGIAGLAMTDAGVRPSGFSDTEITVGTEFGIGAEMALRNGWSTRIDLTANDLSGQSQTFNGSKKDIDFNNQQISIGISKRF